MKTAADRRIESEGRLLYTLLDGAEDAGLLAGATGERWREIRTEIVCGATYESRAASLHSLLGELEAGGALRGTWIEARWRTIALRVAVR